MYHCHRVLTVGQRYVVSSEQQQQCRRALRVLAGEGRPPANGHLNHLPVPSHPKTATALVHPVTPIARTHITQPAPQSN